MRFSIIVPIYKVEKYIRACIDSVLAQSFTDFELILVDDGSPDVCPTICDEYATVDSRIRVIHKENGGLVSARQAGIRIAQGEYIVNLDGDDALCADALQHADDILRETAADIVSFSYRYCKNGEVGGIVEDIVPEGLYNKADIERVIYPKLLCDKTMQHMFYFLWGKAIKRELVLPHQLQVNPAISLGEDLSCIVPCYLDAQTVYISKQVAYLYTIRDDSISTDFKTQQLTQIQDVIAGLRALTLPVPSDFEEQIARYSCFMCFAILAAAAEGNHFRALKQIKRLIRHSVHDAEIRKAQFDGITLKSRIAVFLMKRRAIGAAFYFLNICKILKHMRKRERT